MKDDKLKIKQDELIEMISSFCDEHLDEEYKNLCVKLVEKLGRKHNVPFKRGKLEIWASAVIYAIAQINFLFDKSSELYISPDSICEYFNTKKSTVSNKAKTIRDMFNMTHFDKEFSPKYILADEPKIYMDDNGFIIPENFVEQPNKMDMFFNGIFELYAEGKTDKAMALLDTIQEDDPEYSRALFYKSMMLGQEGDEKEAFENFKKVLSIEFNQNLDYGDDVGLFDNFKSLVNLSADDEDMYLRALSFADEDDFETALNVINKAIEMNPNNDKYWNDKGNFLVRLELYDEAHESFDKAIELNPNDSIIWANKGFAYNEEDKPKQALKCYNKACELSPDDIHPIIGKVKVYLALDDMGNAKKYLDIAEKMDNADFEYLLEKGSYMISIDNFKGAVKYLDRCLEIDDENVQALFLKSVSLLQLGDEKGAEDCINKLYEINPSLLDDVDI